MVDAIANKRHRIKFMYLLNFHWVSLCKCLFLRQCDRLIKKKITCQFHIDTDECTLPHWCVRKCVPGRFIMTMENGLYESSPFMFQSNYEPCPLNIKIGKLIERNECYIHIHIHIRTDIYCNILNCPIEYLSALDIYNLCSVINQYALVCLILDWNCFFYFCLKKKNNLLTNYETN